MKNMSRTAALVLALLWTGLAKAEPTSPSSEVRLVVAGNASSAQIQFVTASFLAPLKASPILGRDFLPADFKKAAPPAAIISHELWTQAAGQIPNLIGNKVRIEEREFTIVAIAPPKPSELAGRKVWLASAN